MFKIPKIYFFTPQVFSPIDRSNLLDDALNLARATHIKYPTALGMTSYMSKEMDYFPWRTAFSALNYINNQLYGEPDYNLWRVRTNEGMDFCSDLTWWSSWCLKLPVVWLFVQQFVQLKCKNIKAPHYWYFLRRIHRWPVGFPSQYI